MPLINDLDLHKVNDAALAATQKAHTAGDVPCQRIVISRLCENSLGELIAFFQLSCALSATMQGVNPFDQPGVEAYKKHLHGWLNQPR